jgi:hypothetical protein
VWNIYFGPIEQTVCPNTTGGDQHEYESREDITLNEFWYHTVFNNILTVLFDTFTNNVSFLYLFLFLI